MDTSGTATFGYTRFFAYGQLIVGPILMVPFVGLFCFGLYMLATGGARDHVLTVLGGMAASLWVLIIFFQWIRYRHALSERYTLDSKGVRIESSTGTSHLEWSDFDRAEYLTVPGMLRLTSNRLRKPVFLFMNRGWRVRQDQDRNNLALSLVKQYMGARYKRVLTL